MIQHFIKAVTVRDVLVRNSDKRLQTWLNRIRMSSAKHLKHLSPKMETKQNQTWISQLATCYQHWLMDVKTLNIFCLHSCLLLHCCCTSNKNVVLLIHHRFKIGKSFVLYVPLKANWLEVERKGMHRSCTLHTVCVYMCRTWACLRPPHWHLECFL